MSRLGKTSPIPRETGTTAIAALQTQPPNLGEAELLAQRHAQRVGKTGPRSEASSGTSCLPSPSSQPWEDAPCSLKPLMRAERKSHGIIS